MKTYFFFLGTFIPAFVINAQVETPSLKPDQVMVIALDSVTGSAPLTKNIHKVEVADLREDTSSVGYYTAASRHTSKIVFKTGTTAAVSLWMPGHLQLSGDSVSGDVLFAVIRRLRLSDEIIPVVSANGHPGNGENGWERGVAVKMEYYLKRGSIYFPLYRFDSVLLFRESFFKNAGQFVTASLAASLEKLYTVNTDAVINGGRKVTLPEICNRVYKNTYLPVFTDTAYKKGVYASFEEFKMNNPSTATYEFKKGRLGDLLYVKKDGKEYPERTAWGFCDGKDIYIYSADKFSQLLREGNTFTFRGIKSITRKVSHDLLKSSVLNLITNTGEKRTDYLLRLKYYQLDMETGEIY